MSDTDSDQIVVIHDGLAYVFTDEASLQEWSLHDSPTYQHVTRATEEELKAAADWPNSAPHSQGQR